MRRLSAAERTVRTEVITRDRRCRLATVEHSWPCFGGLTVHHLKKASAGGEYTLENLIVLSAVCNEMIEVEPLWAHRLGLVCRRGDSLDECWERMAVAGIVDYTPDGSPLDQYRPASYSGLDVHR